MGVDLMGHGGESFNWHAWRRCLEVGAANGWPPEGTRPSRFVDEWGQPIERGYTGPVWIEEDSESDEHPGYFSNDYQAVSDRDAANIAQALNRRAPHGSAQGRIEP
jgi:hypothetical protein